MHFALTSCSESGVKRIDEKSRVGVARIQPASAHGCRATQRAGLAVRLRTPIAVSRRSGSGYLSLELLFSQDPLRPQLAYRYRCLIDSSCARPLVLCQPDASSLVAHGPNGAQQSLGARFNGCPPARG
jgi:hypothetical protein